MSRSLPASLTSDLRAGAARPVLTYGRGDGGFCWRLRHTLIAALLGATAVGSWFAGRAAREQAQVLLWQQQAADFSLPAETVVFEPGPEAAGLVSLPDYYLLPGSDLSQPVAVRTEPASHKPFAEAALRAAEKDDRPADSESLGTLVFLHELTTPGGLRRIVAVHFLPRYLADGTMSGPGLVTHVFEPAGPLSRPQEVGRSTATVLQPAATLPSAGGLGSETWSLGPWTPDLPDGTQSQTQDPLGTLRWFAGQPATHDASRFTLPYEIAGVRGIIDGTLSDDGASVRLSIRPPRTENELPHASSVDTQPGAGELQPVAIY